MHACDIAAKTLECEALTEAGVRHRMGEYYIPLFKSFQAENALRGSDVRALDCGCGNGVAVEMLTRAGISAYGVNLWDFRPRQWKERDFEERRTRCLFGDATRLPFADESFNIVMSCGLLEHVGVEEEWEPRYRVRPQPDQFEQRTRFMRECLRVLRKPGVLYIDHPNRAFPVDFQHYTGNSGARPHWPWEEFLPDFRELKALPAAAGCDARLEAISPAGRFHYKNVGRKWWGRVFSAPSRAMFWLMERTIFQPLSSTALNPYLVVRVEARDRLRG